MTDAVGREPSYLAEWYWPEVGSDRLQDVAARLDECVSVMCAEGLPVVRVMILAVPTDETMFGLFAAGSKGVVAELCRRAGVPPARLNAAVAAPPTTVGDLRRWTYESS